MLSFIRRYYLLMGVLLIIITGGLLSLIGYTEQGKWVLVSGSLIVSGRLIIEMILTLRSGRIGIDILALAAIASTLWVGEYWATTVIVLMLTGGEALERYASQRARKELTSLLNNAPQIAHRITGDTIEEVAIQDIMEGDQLSIRPGEVVPVDSRLESDDAELDESSLTGESLPVSVQKGAELLSGSINQAEVIIVTALRRAEESQYQKIVALVKAAADSQAPFVRLADRFAIPFTIVSFVIAGTAWAVSGESVRFAEVLVLATPCPLLLATPIALISGMSRSARNGIIVKSGEVLERLSRIKAVAFDKTGTLTKGAPEVSQIIPAQGYDERDVLRIAASAERQSLHTLALAVVSAAESRHIDLTEVDELEEVVAQGVTAEIDHQAIIVGKRSFLESHGIAIPSDHHTSGTTSVWVAKADSLVGTIEFEDVVRPESRQTIRQLKQIGVRLIMMLTGDADATAHRIASTLGIDSVHSQLLPEDKVRLIKTAPVRPIMMVGDGINDAPVLAVADVGVAMGARGASAATETADVVVLVEDIRKSWQAMFIAKQTISIAVQGMILGIGLSIVLMLIATTGVIPAIIGATLQEVIDVIVILNALRVHSMKIS